MKHTDTPEQTQPRRNRTTTPSSPTGDVVVARVLRAPTTSAG